MTDRRKMGRVSDETFDDFLAGEGLQEACEMQAIKELIAEQNLAATVKANAQAALPVMASEAKPSSPAALVGWQDSLDQAEPLDRFASLAMTDW